jgi:ABC-2 type transport system permease protein
MGVDYALILVEYTQTTMTVPSIYPLFETFWIPTVCVVPLLTMKTLSEERQRGTLEALLSTPAGVTSIVLSKFFSTYLFYVSMWCLTLLYPTVARLTLQLHDSSALYTAPTLGGGLTFVVLSSAVFIAAGICTSALTKNQIVAGLSCFCLLFVVLVASRLSTEISWIRLKYGHIGTFVDFFQHLDELSHGIFDTRVLAFYFVGTFLFLGLTRVGLAIKNYG